MNELKPCPFCGGKADIYLSNDVPPSYGVWHYCMFGKNTYDIKVETRWRRTKQEAIDLWNSRGTMNETTN